MTPKLLFADWAKQYKGFLFCSIRSQRSQSRLEMVWRDSFPRGSYMFCRKLSPLRFLSGLHRFAPTNCPWVSEVVGEYNKAFFFYDMLIHFFPQKETCFGNRKYEQLTTRYYLLSHINSSSNATAVFYTQHTNTFFIAALQEFTFYSCNFL